MAKGSKSSTDNGKTEISDETEASETEAEEAVDGADSSGNGPVVTEANAETEDEDASEAEGSDVGESADEGASDEAPEPPPPATVPQPERSGPGALALIFGGIVAGAIGYGASFLAPPATDPELAASVGASAERIDALAADVAALRDTPAAEADLSGIEAQLGELSGRMDSIDEDVTVLQNALEQTSAALEAGTEDLSQRIAALESIDPTGLTEASADQIAAFRERLETISTEAETRLKAVTEQAAALEAQAAARAEELQAAAEAAAAQAEQEAARIEAEARRRAALADLSAAMDSGTAFPEALDALGEAPEDLAVLAEKGVPTLGELQRSFPAAARAALTQASTVSEDASAGDRFAAFLKRRTGARSLTPQEGSSPDAILSRAEAALSDGDLATALAEVETLPEPSLEAMSDWIVLARTRASALEALNGLTATN